MVLGVYNRMITQGEDHAVTREGDARVAGLAATWLQLRSTCAPTSRSLCPLEQDHVDESAQTDQKNPATFERRWDLPASGSIVRLADVVLVVQHDEWQATNPRYLSEDSMAQIGDPTRG